MEKDLLDILVSMPFGLILVLIFTYAAIYSINDSQDKDE